MVIMIYEEIVIILKLGIPNILRNFYIIDFVFY